MVETPQSLEDELSRGQRWSTVTPYRSRLLNLARALGAGGNAEDIVHETLLTAAQYGALDQDRVWSLLRTIAMRRIADQYRLKARSQILFRHRALLPLSSSLEQDVVDRAEAEWLTEKLVQMLPSGIMDAVWRHHIGGMTWAELAVERGTSADALKQRISRALLGVLHKIDLAQGRPGTRNLSRW